MARMKHRFNQKARQSQKKQVVVVESEANKVFLYEIRFVQFYLRVETNHSSFEKRSQLTKFDYILNPKTTGRSRSGSTRREAFIGKI